MITTVLFDLDGTLVDTAPDLGYALNLQLQKHGQPILSDQTIRPFASHGSSALLNLGFGISKEDNHFKTMQDEYLDLYASVLTRSSQLFDGMSDLLKAITAQGLQWGIVTNKPRRFTQPIVKGLGLSQSAACVVSGDDAPKPKPSPETLLLACEQADVKPESCIYVGDAKRDVEAGKAAGMKTIVALYGYLDQHDKPTEWGADQLIQMPQEILSCIN